MNPDSSLAAGLALAALPIGISAVLNMGEAASVYADDIALRHMSASGDKKAAKMLRLLEKHPAVESSVSTVSALCLVLSVWGITRIWTLIAPDLAQSAGAAAGAALAGTFLFTGLGVIAPRRLAADLSENLAFAMFGPLSLACAVLTPVVWLEDAVSSLFVRLAGKNPDEIPRHVTEEEIRMLIDEGEERGAIEEAEKDMINNIFEFDTRDVTDVMTHRTEVSAVEITAPLQEVVQLALDTGYSRIPVYVDSIDSICGVVYAKNLLKYFNNPGEFRMSDELRRPLYVPETTSCAALFALFKREKTQIAVVVDEYGGTYGIVTMEDLLESIVGSMEDEFDNEVALSTQVDEGVYILDGSMSVAEFEHLLGLRVPEDFDCDTLGGFVTELLGDVPGDDSPTHSVHFGGVTFTVIHTDGKKIGKIRAVMKSKAN